MSVPYQAARLQDRPQFFTIQGLASTFGISCATIRKYIVWGHVNPASGCRPDGFNYDLTHYRQIARVRLAKKPLSYGRNRHANVVIYARTAQEAVA